MRIRESRIRPVLAIVALGVVLGLPGTAIAGKSKKWRANNHSDKTVKVFWTALGCAGVKDNPCTGGDMPTVCKAEILRPGESSDYRFKDGTSNRKKHVTTLDEVDGMCYRDDTSSRKKNGIEWVESGDEGLHWFYD